MLAFDGLSDAQTFSEGRTGMRLEGISNTNMNTTAIEELPRCSLDLITEDIMKGKILQRQGTWENVGNWFCDAFYVPSHCSLGSPSDVQQNLKMSPE